MSKELDNLDLQFIADRIGHDNPLMDKLIKINQSLTTNDEVWVIETTDEDIDTKVVWLDGINLNKRAILNMFDFWTKNNKTPTIPNEFEIEFNCECGLETIIYSDINYCPNCGVKVKRR